MHRLLERLELSRAVLYALALRAWQLVGGLVSVLLIATFFSPVEQGYWYTFFSLTALQSFFELGFAIVVINVASHEWARLGLDESGRIVGDAAALSRLVSLGRLLMRWNAVIVPMFVGVVGIAGFCFLAEQPGADVSWRAPWIAVVLLSGLMLGALPFIALLEGSGQVTTVNGFRVVQAVAANLAVWTAIVLGAGLWTAVAVTGVRLACEVYLLAVRYRRFFAPFYARYSGPSAAPAWERLMWTLCFGLGRSRDLAQIGPGQSLGARQIDWRREIWPMQWRLGVGSVFQYFVGMFFTPVLFHYDGPEAAGRMGMTWTVLSAVQLGALSWMQTRVPQFGALVAQRRFEQLDRLFFRLLTVSLAALAAAGTLFWAAVWVLPYASPKLSSRLLPPVPTALFVMALAAYHVPLCFRLYIRAHKREPTALLALIAVSNSAIGFLVWLVGGYSGYGATGVTGAFLAVVALFMLPCEYILWRVFRRSRTT